MHITQLAVTNFRSIKQLTVELGTTTGFISPNNPGTIAFLDAVRIAVAFYLDVLLNHFVSNPSMVATGIPATAWRRWVLD